MSASSLFAIAVMTSLVAVSPPPTSEAHPDASGESGADDARATPASTEPSSTPPPTEPSIHPDGTAIATILLRVPDELHERLADALRLRLPEVVILRHGEDTAADNARLSSGQDFAFVGVGALHGESVTLVVITNDGSAWSREVSVDEDAATALARELAVLIVSIEAGEVVPEHTDVPIPAADVQETNPETFLERAEDVPKSAHEPTPPAAAASDDTAGHPERSLSPPNVEVGVSISPLLIASLPPQLYSDAFAGVGGAVDVDLRTRRGLAITLDVRTTADFATPITIVRTRFAAGVGGALVRGRLHADLMVFGSIESFVVRGGGEALGLTGDTGAAAAPLIGGFARADLLGRVFHRRNTKLLLGPRLEVGASVSPSGNVPALADPRGAAFRPGGLELGLGVVLRVLVGVPAPRSGSGAQPRPGRRR